ncbi:hypothetical protein [Arthrobacter sp. H35-D1]|uniref:hypothetical protein n=1 Tax=Arthrobacter sp. H35-D1 TaxID=3046202 RepID=UPI0024B87BE0|nr:hypothetical protein [Arthrobacter sp. H35-D1]MDJ0315257.1 hypothetical protein [Arthrobacter sp. H35-D1]
MRQTAGTLNRTWLAILGILILAAGAALLLQTTGILQKVFQTPAPGTKIVTGELHSFFAQQWLIIIFLIISVVVGVLALVWIIAQIPVKNLAETYRLHQEGAQGRTSCDPSVLASAVEHQIDSLPDVLTSTVILRGTVDEPDVTLRVTVNDQADIRALLRHVERTTLAELSTALEAPLHKRRVQIDVSARKQNTGTVRPSTGTVLQ